jgi:hypothetical protein
MFKATEVAVASIYSAAAPTPAPATSVSVVVDLQLALEQIAGAPVMELDDAKHFDLTVPGLEFFAQDGRIGLPSPGHHGVELSLGHDQIRVVTALVPDPGVSRKDGPEENDFGGGVHLARGKCKGVAGIGRILGIKPKDIRIGIPSVSVNQFLRHG